MSRSHANRVSRLEAAVIPPAPPVPNVLRVQRSETIADARARFAATYPDAPRGHCLLVVPERIRTPEDEAEFAIRFKAQQLQLVADARSRR